MTQQFELGSLQGYDLQWWLSARNPSVPVLRLAMCDIIGVQLIIFDGGTGSKSSSIQPWSPMTILDVSCDGVWAECHSRSAPV